MRFKNSPHLPGAGRTRAWHHHGSETPTSHRAILDRTDQFHVSFYTRLYSLLQTKVHQGLLNLRVPAYIDRKGNKY